MSAAAIPLLKGILAQLRTASFLSDFSSTFASRLASKVIMAFVVALAARRLGPQTFGTYVAIVTYAGMAAALVDFGLAPYVTRTTSAGAPAHQPLAVALAVRMTIFGALLVLGTVGGMIWQTGSSWSIAAVYVVATMLIDLITDLLLAALRGYGRFNVIARTTLVRSATCLLATSAFVFFESTLSMLTFAFLVSSTAGLGYTAWQCRDFWEVAGARWKMNRPVFRMQGALGALGATWAFGVSGILGSVYMRLGPAVLAHSSGVEAGIYGAAYKVIEAGLFGASIVCSILVPYLSATRAASEEQFQQMVGASMRLLVIPTFLFANLLIVFADPLIALLYGPRFAGAGTVLEILSLFLLMGAIAGGAQAAILISIGEMKYVSWLMGGALAIGLPLNLALAPLYGAIGAAIASSVGEAFLLTANLILLERRGLDTQTGLVLLCLLLTVTAIVAQHLPTPVPLIPPAVYALLFGRKCFGDLRWSIGKLSDGRLMMARLRCG